MRAAMSLPAARALGINVGTDPNVAITTGGVVLVSDVPFDEREAEIFAGAVCNLDGDGICLPPFTVRRGGE
jgi:hypothetical protein